MTSGDDDAAKAAADADAARDEEARAAEAAQAAALARAEEAEREAASAQADLDAAAASLRAVQERAAAERAAAAPSKEDDADAFHHGEDDIDLQAALLQQEAAVLLNLHAQAVSVQNIRTLVPLLLDVNSTFYARWKESFLDVLGKYSLERHVLSDAVAPASPSWVRMNCVVRTWLLGAISDDLADSVSERGASARAIWLAIESQFLGNRTTRALYADQEFRAFSQGDLSVVDYCRRFKRMAEDLRDLGQPISEETLVLNIIRGLNERFSALGLHLRRSTPLPSFLQVRDDLRLEELTMAKAPPAAALTALSGSSTGGSGGSKPPTPAPPRPPQQQDSSPKTPQQSASNSGGGGFQRGKRGGKRFNKGGGGGGSSAGGASGNASGGGSSSPATAPPTGTSFYNPWTGAIYMWPGPRAPMPPRAAPPAQHQTYVAGPPGQWTGQWGVPSPAAPLSPGWDQQALAAQFQTMSLQQPPQQDWYFDTGATTHMASDAGILSTSTVPSSHSSSSIIVGNGNLLPVVSTGSTVLPHNLHLNKVLVSPNLIKNLISVRQFTIDNNCTVEFDPFGCSVKDLPTRNEIVRCNSSGPLYPLQLPASALLASSTSSLWHQRLGHPGHEVLSR